MVPSLERRCHLPDLPGPRVGHGQAGKVVCGGGQTDSDGGWNYFQGCEREVGQDTVTGLGSCNVSHKMYFLVKFERGKLGPDLKLSPED